MVSLGSLCFPLTPIRWLQKTPHHTVIRQDSLHQLFNL